ncbi:HAD family hydrolase [Frigidibacter sp. ROC022]|uniref:HAD family hydrolase n=1 Tax=Frigidibacter sp. ROC022 TaxID=2971796 RepID=UPI00215A5EC0|nr:HAD family phosphatase [Frigidibacter sp. ROC022]MCR8723461.1 HAD family phosphatase [Frigidibacter sp. ROC022]
MTSALLFDLDGTLLCSDPLHVAVFIDIFAAHGVTITEADYMAHIIGRSNAAIFGHFLPGMDPAPLSEAKEAAFRARLGDSVPPVPGLLDLLAWAETEALPCAVVTNAPPANATAMLSAIGLATRFDVVVTEGDTPRGKPDPAPYALALDRLGADPARSLAFEDSPSGIRAAVAAGLTTVGMRSSLSDATLREAGATLTIPDFTDPALQPLLERLQGADA